MKPMRSFVTFTLLLTFVCFPFVAAAKKNDTTKDKDIQKLMELTGAAQMSEQMIQQMIRMQEPMMPADKKACFEEYQQHFLEEANAEELQAQMVSVYAKHFTQKEIKGLIKFYQSPLGKSLIEKQPLIMRESIQIGQQWGMEAGKRAGQKMSSACRQ